MLIKGPALSPPTGTKTTQAKAHIEEHPFLEGGFLNLPIVKNIDEPTFLRRDLESFLDRATPVDSNLERHVEYRYLDELTLPDEQESDKVWRAKAYGFLFQPLKIRENPRR